MPYPITCPMCHSDLLESNSIKIQVISLGNLSLEGKVEWEDSTETQTYLFCNECEWRLQEVKV